MNIRLIYSITGYVSIAIGIAATLCIYRIQFVKLGVALAIPGMLIAGINIFLNAKYFSERDKFPKGYLGMFLSSLPVIFMLLIIFKFRA